MARSPYRIELDNAEIRRLQTNINQLVNEIGDGLETLINDSAMIAVRDAKNNAPVDTGYLRNNIRVSGRGKNVEIISGAEYSTVIEFGTRIRRARPYFYPAIKNALLYLNRNLNRLGD